MSVVYPAIFLKEEIGFSVSFPDLSGCFSEGDTLEQAIEMAQEALGLFLVSMEERGISIPPSSNISDLHCENGEFATLISTNTDRYRRNKSVKKTLTIPLWLNEQAEKANLNFSQTLQKALKEELQVIDR